ncbi:hypothetical protein KUH03_05915 [Sphingobacterium sp. E70]|uniref:hypothetical protein n=1 Tax=Sphingobacterium sp. E70 TaxID=2853439 RepID=UPI00211BD176|nr:hypothetical protein [Sphingobacterium sp. E70]ULT26431.1 hypothetical protein KUH03_05915 [Sphingobacterium sp. E70]
MFKHFDPKFENSETDIRATLALLVSGIYYLALQAKSTGSTFCGIDINTEEGKIRIEKTVEKILKQAFADID